MYLLSGILDGFGGRVANGAVFVAEGAALVDYLLARLEQTDVDGAVASRGSHVACDGERHGKAGNILALFSAFAVLDRKSVV